MDYTEINKEHKRRMNLAIKGDAYRTERMDWEDPNLMIIMTGKYPRLRIPSYSTDKVDTSDIIEIQEAAVKMQKLVNNFVYFDTDITAFINKLKKYNAVFSAHHSRWSGVDIYTYDYWFKIMRRCLILGEGGIGKTFFVYELEKALEQCGKKHLCVYGKYYDDIEAIEFEQIREIATKEEFIFVVDAYNELSIDNQVRLISFLEQSDNVKGLRVIVTLRTGTLNEKQFGEISRLFENTVNFRGVSFEAALELLKHLPISELYQYEDILYSNNALQLKMLHTVLTKATSHNTDKNSINRITYIIENYIKTAANKQIWKDTKTICSWIYNHENTRVPLHEIKLIISDVPRYLSAMNRIGLISSYARNDVEYFVFNNESIMDFLVARYLFQELGQLDLCGQIKLIKQKVDSIYGLREAAILVIFDKCEDDYQGAYELLQKTELLSGLNYETLLKVNFSKHSESFLKVFKIENPSSLLPIFGGYIDKPFNCTNYLNKYYKVRKHQTALLSGLLSGQQHGRIIDRLQHLLYFITVDNHTDRNDDEIFYFALWCCAAPNESIRYLAIKLLYDLACNSCHYQMMLVDAFSYIVDSYIQESIIRVLTKCNPTDAVKSIRELFTCLLTSDTFLLAKALQMICDWNGEPYEYINYNKKNLYGHKAKSRISKQLNSIFFLADIYEKHLLNFRYWSSDHIDIYRQFIDADKNKVLAWNEQATKTFECVRIHSEDSWCNPSKKDVERIIPVDFECRELHQKSFLSSFGKVIKETFAEYGLSYSTKNSFNLDEYLFRYSPERKALIVAQEIYYGSLMCNYFTNEFVCFNNDQSIMGYSIYDPREYDDATIHVTSPLPTFSSNVIELENRTISRFEEPKRHDVAWVKDMSITERNLCKLSECIEFRNENWVLIAGRVYLKGKSDGESEWSDTYDYWICTSDNYMLDESMENRYLTIELPDYKESMEQYTVLSPEPHRCHSVYSIVNNSEVFQDTTLVLPPADIIKELNLHVNYSDMTWRNEKGEIVIYCNNCKSSYLTDDMTGSVFIREKDLEYYLNGKKPKYFAFVEKRIPETGYADETSFHLQIENGKITKRIPNGIDRGTLSEPHYCGECPFEFSQETDENDVSEILNRYLGK